jgi:predicted XRE-type DNA-binding protein
LASLDSYVELSSGNVFADLGLPDADELHAKAELAHEICAIIEHDGLTQKEAAGRMGMDQSKVSAIRHGRLKDFSTDRLMRFLNALGRDVVIAIRTPKLKGHTKVRVVSEEAGRPARISA